MRARSLGREDRRGRPRRPGERPSAPARRRSWRTASCRIEVADVDALFAELAPAGVLHHRARRRRRDRLRHARVRHPRPRRQPPDLLPLGGRVSADRGATSPAETWDAFFSDFYLRAYADAERDGGAGAGARRRAARRRPEGGDVLDAPCGFGRHAIPLAAGGLPGGRRRPLAGAARRGAPPRRPARAGRSSRRPTTATCRSPTRASTPRVDLFSSLGYLGDAEDTRALAEIGRTLRPGGRLVIEIMHRDLLVRDVHRARLAAGRRGPAPARAAHVRPGRRRRAGDPDAGRGDGQRESRPYSVRVYTATELLAMLAARRLRRGEVPRRPRRRAPFGPDTRLVIVGAAARASGGSRSARSRARRAGRARPPRAGARPAGRGSAPARSRPCR